jgi:OOP family OmpA-OmpF porin
LTTSAAEKRHLYLRSFPQTKHYNGMDVLDKIAAENALGRVSKAGGTSPLSRAVDAALTDLGGLPGKTALVIVSDGNDMGLEPLEAAAAIKKTYGDALCIYPIFVGDADDGI